MRHKHVLHPPGPGREALRVRYDFPEEVAHAGHPIFESYIDTVLERLADLAEFSVGTARKPHPTHDIQCPPEGRFTELYGSFQFGTGMVYIGALKRPGRVDPGFELRVGIGHTPGQNVTDLARAFVASMEQLELFLPGYANRGEPFSGIGRGYRLHPLKPGEGATRAVFHRDLLAIGYDRVLDNLSESLHGGLLSTPEVTDARGMEPAFTGKRLEQFVYRDARYGDSIVTIGEVEGPTACVEVWRPADDQSDTAKTFMRMPGEIDGIGSIGNWELHTEAGGGPT